MKNTLKKILRYLIMENVWSDDVPSLHSYCFVVYNGNSDKYFKILEKELQYQILKLKFAWTDLLIGMYMVL